MSPEPPSRQSPSCPPDTAGAAAARSRPAAPPAPGTPWREACWVAVDLELTGLNPARHEIVAIGAVPIRDGRVALGDALYTLVRPGRPSELEAILVHKLRREDLAGAPAIDAALAPLLELLAGAVPVFHTAAAERAFLGRELARHGLVLPPSADTEVLGRAWLAQHGRPVPSGLPLAGLAAELGQRVEPLHHALGDALTTASAFIALAGLADRTDRQTVASLTGTG